MKKINCLIIGLVFAFFVLINTANGRVVEVDFQKNDLNDLIVEEMPLEYPFDQERPKIEGNDRFKTTLFLNSIYFFS